MIRILHGTKLTLQQDILALVDRVPQILGYVTYVGLYHLLILHQLLIDLVLIESRLMIQILQNHIFLYAYIGDLIAKILFVCEQLADLETDLCVFIRIEGRDTGLGGTEGFSSQTFLLALVKQDMIRHHNLRTVGYKNLRGRNSLLHNALNLVEQNRNIQCDSISNDAGGVIVKYTRRQAVQRELSVIIYDCVACVCTALKTDDDIRLLSKHICDLALSLVTPVGAYDCFYHSLYPSIRFKY